MSPITTNRDLYLFIAELVKRQLQTNISLETYLANLRRLGRARRDREALSLAEFAEMLAAAFDAPSSEASVPTTCASGYEHWETRVDEQIRDLREMVEAGKLGEEYRYFGIDAPSGARWYNFDPVAFLECGAAGSFGGWQEGDDTGRGYVPGKVAVIDDSGALTTADPRDVDEPVVALSEVTWQSFVEFLDAGQYYE